jgi:hypothetical protein
MLPRLMPGLITLCYCLCLVSCSPSGDGKAPPAYLKVLTEFLEFGPNQSVDVVLISNPGGYSLAFTVTATATFAETTWLELDREQGFIEAGSTVALTASVINRDDLQPATYTGKLTIEAEGQDAQTVEVTMVVGQPLLSVDPSSKLEFTTSDTTRNLIIKNVGEGYLDYTVHLPGPWISTDGDLQKSISPTEIQTLALTVDRNIADWYGEGGGELVVTSNGAVSGAFVDSMVIPVTVHIDPACSVNADCTKPGYYCNTDVGECTGTLSVGNPCTSKNACNSGLCVDAHCCDNACTDTCHACDVEENIGTCSPVIDNRTCDDEDNHTRDDICMAGNCAGTAYDCDDQLDCTTEIYDGEGGCNYTVSENKCLIAESCYHSGDEKSGSAGCLTCQPEIDAGNWTAVANDTECDDGSPCTLDDVCFDGICSGTDKDCSDSLACTTDSCEPGTGDCTNELQANWCLIDGTCFSAGSKPGGASGPCRICTPELTAAAWSPEAEDGPCDDGSPCSTTSACKTGECIAVGPLCDDDNPCTANTCTPEDTCDNAPLPDSEPCPDDGEVCTDDVCMSGTCTHPVTTNKCLIAGQCLDVGTVHADNECLLCNPDSDPLSWIPGNEGLGCDDTLYCIVEEVCTDGECTGQPRLCESDECSEGYCQEDTDQCLYVPVKDGTICNDTNPCTDSDGCLDGICLGADKDCTWAANGNPCLDTLCDPESAPEPGACITQDTTIDTPCDDGLNCTASTVCDGAGTCGGGSVKNPQDCDTELANENPCQAGLCQEPDGCILHPLDNGTGCNLFQASGTCFAGDCTITQCNGGYDDCNEQDSDGCEAELASNIAHCGKCDNSCIIPSASSACLEGQCAIGECFEGYDDCDESLENGCESLLASDPDHCGNCAISCTVADPGLTGTCQDNVCGSTACDAGFVNIDLAPGNGCECEIKGNEECNKVDDNCNGEIDEGFELLTDENNCGECGNVCSHESVNQWQCQAGKCEVLECKVGYTDFDGFPHNGCELELQGELWVNGTFNDPAEDGTEEHPFNDIVEAISAAEEEYLIHVIAGEFDGEITIDKKNITIAGAGPEHVVINVEKDGTGIIVTTNSVTIAGLRIVSGRYGIHYAGTALKKIKGGQVSNVQLQQQQGKSGSVDSTTAGLRLEYCVGTSISNIVIQGTVGAAINAGRAAGIWLDNSNDCTINDTHIQDTQGGVSGYMVNVLGRPGGTAAGILVEHSDNNAISNSTIKLVSGSASGDATGVCLTGGKGTGIFFSDSTNNAVSACILNNIEGGDGGTSENGSHGAPENGYGIYLEDDSLANTIHLDNSLDDDPIVYIYGESDLVLGPFQIYGQTNPTNLGKIAVIDSVNITIQDSSVADYRGESGKGGKYEDFQPLPSVSGLPGVGIRLEECNGCAVQNCTVLNIEGGQGAAAQSVHGYHYAVSNRVKRRGGSAIGIWVKSSPACNLENNSISGITGGAGGWPDGGFEVPAFVGDGGNGAGIHIEDSVGCTLSGNTLQDLNGGEIMEAAPAWDSHMFTPTEGTAFGIYLAADSIYNQIDLTNTVEEDPVVFLNDVSDLVIENFQLTDQTNPTNWGKVAVFDSHNISIYGNTISGFKGSSRAKKSDDPAMDEKWVSAGIRVVGCTSCSIQGNSVSNIEGGMSYSDGGVGPGGLSVGVLVSGSTLTQLSGNSIDSIFGGHARFGPANNPGGPAVGIHVEDSVISKVTNNIVRDIDGGHGTIKGGKYGGDPNTAGPATGFWTSESSLQDFSGNIFASILPGETGISDKAPDSARCIELAGYFTGIIEHFTCYQIGGAKAGNGIYVSGPQFDQVTVSNSIFSTINGSAVTNFEANSDSIITVEFSDLWECNGATTNATEGPGLIAGDPKFTSASQHKFTLKPTSPCIDAGNPAAGCPSEPSPNGCRVNMGAFGNTIDAATKYGAEHCDVCP